MNKHNFTPFAESLPKQGRWILVTNDLEFKKKNGELEDLRLTDEWVEYKGKFYAPFANLGEEFSYWRYAVEEGG